MHEIKELILEFCMPVVDWCTGLGEPGLFILAFIEASFFLLPPELLLTPMVIKAINNPYILAIITTIGSVLGAVFGYYIGKLGGRPIAEQILGAKASVLLDKAEEFFEKFGNTAILIAAFTPIPYKVFTISGGICRMNLVGFIIYSLIGRGSRYLIFVFLLTKFGAVVLENFFKFTLVVVIIFISYKLVNKLLMSGKS